MNEGAKAFVGKHDFAAFCAAGSSVSTTVRTIFDCHVEQEGPHIRILVIRCRWLLYNMVDPGWYLTLWDRVPQKSGRNHRRQRPQTGRTDRRAAGLDFTGNLLRFALESP